LPTRHIHLGTCDKLDKAPKWNLEAVKGGRSVTGSRFARYHPERQDGDQHSQKRGRAQIYVSCGNIIGLM
jgi:hypothetical protein